MEDVVVVVRGQFQQQSQLQANGIITTTTLTTTTTQFNSTNSSSATTPNAALAEAVCLNKDKDMQIELLKGHLVRRNKLMQEQR